MYQVIIVLDEFNSKNYYYSYVAADGNIECEELPPYQDIDKARACWWDADNAAWVYDNEKYNKIVETKQRQRKEATEAAAKTAAQPTISEMSDAVLELAESISDIESALAELGSIVGEGV